MGDAVDAAHKLRTALDAISKAQYSILRSEFLMDLSVVMARSGAVGYNSLAHREDASEMSREPRCPVRYVQNH